MRHGIRNLRIDRERATRCVALAGLLLLGISTLPGLLKTPDPPPVPADVGFHPGELTGYTAGRSASADRRVGGKRDHGPKRRPDRRQRKPARKETPEPTGRETTGSGGGPSTGSSGPAPSAPPPAPPAPASPPPVYSPPPPSPPPPSPAPPPRPTDGSEEFAPR